MLTVLRPGYGKIMQLFYRDKAVKLHLREIARQTELFEPSAYRFLNSLEKDRILKSEKDGNLKKYSVKQGIRAYFLFEAFDLERFEKLPSIRRNAIKTYWDSLPKKPVFAMLFGSTAKGTYKEDSDIDILLVTNNKINGEQGVRTKHNFEFAFGAIKSNMLKRDLAPHQSGEDRLYVQGAAGSMATIDLFKNENIIDLQKNNWLINDASLTFYVDQNAASNIAPEQLFIYNYTENLQLTDVMTEGLVAVSGLLERDDNGKPYRYVFKITDYISKLLKSTEPLDLVKIGLKVYNPSDTPSAIDDVKIKDYSWTPKGVVLFGDDPSFGDKRVKLEISYTKLNN